MAGIDVFSRVKAITRPLWIADLLAVLFCNFALLFAANSAAPSPPGRLVELGGYKAHIQCTGSGAPTVVVASGLGDFSTDWVNVQSPLSAVTRVCTYDRPGYAWSDPGPKPRTFAQINLEMHEALARSGERGPFVLVGHSFGGPVVRSYALDYSGEVAGVVFVDAAHEGLRVSVGGGKTIRLGEGAKARAIPAPRLQTTRADAPTVGSDDLPLSELAVLRGALSGLPPAARAARL